MSNDAQPLMGYQVPEEAPYQAYDKPVEPAYLPKAFQEAEEAYGESLRKRLEEETASRISPTISIDAEKEAKQKAYRESLKEVDFRKVWEDLKKLPLFQLFQETAKPSEAYGEEIRQAMKRFQAQRDFDPNKPPLMPEPKHVHGPFTFLMNQNHNALRGCQSCGAAWVGSMAGNEDNLRWHPVYEIEEEE